MPAPNSVPVYKFWNPSSGAIGGIIASLVLISAMHLAVAIGKLT